MKALSNRHPFMLASMKKERHMPRAQYQTDAWGRKWAERKNGNLWKEEICEEEKFLRAIIP